MLMLLDEFSIVPELWSFFEAVPEDADCGSEFLRFIDTFAGFVLTIPEPEKMRRTLKMIHVYHSIESGSDQKRCVREMASFYSTPDEEIMRLYRKIKAMIQERQDRIVDGPGPVAKRHFKPNRRPMEMKRRARDGMKRKDRLCPESE